jgi:hypothetical protein
MARRLGRLARGFVSNVSNINDERFRETIRVGRERSETLKDAFGAAWRSAAEEWRAAAEERASQEQASEEYTSRYQSTNAWWATAPHYTLRKYPPQVLAAYRRLGLGAGSPLEEVHGKRRELVKRCHPDRFVDPEQRVRAERLTAEINAAHDVIERYLLRR